MDNGLVPRTINASKTIEGGLNPCCSGQWSRTAIWRFTHGCYNVLILIVVDNGLEPIAAEVTEVVAEVLILIVVDNGLEPQTTN